MKKSKIKEKIIAEIRKHWPDIEENYDKESSKESLEYLIGVIDNIQIKKPKSNSSLLKEYNSAIKSVEDNIRKKRFCLYDVLGPRIYREANKNENKRKQKKFQNECS